MPEDIKGMKIRPAQSTIGQMVTMLGGTNVQASAPEAREVLERGVADGIFFPWGSMFLFGLDKVTKYHIDAPLYSTVFTYSMNKAKYDAMSPAQKKVIDDHCTTEWAVKLASPWHDFEAAGRAKMRAAAGHEVYKLTPDQLKAWQAAVAPLQKAVGRGGQEGRRRSRRDLQGLARRRGEVQGGVLIRPLRHPDRSRAQRGVVEGPVQFGDVGGPSTAPRRAALRHDAR